GNLEHLSVSALQKNNPPHLFQGGGETGKRIREYDWSPTPVGPIETWPSSLRNAVNILLSSRLPMSIWWGEALTQFYNDAYREAYWPETWQAIYPLIRKVLDEGEGTWSGESSYSPLIDDQAAVRGVLFVGVGSKLRESEDRARLAIDAADLGT